MRVIAGALKGQRLTTPKGRTTRPTADQVRIACLDTLMPYLAAGPFLDLFAGAGGVGIEALSRGAPSAVFVEQDAQALRALRDNVERLGLTLRARVVRDDSPRSAPTLSGLARGDCLEPGAVVVVQHATKTPPAAEIGVLSIWKTRRFGETTLTFFRSPA
jgi:16S rRNA (guanine966-N2)-methyltransferase